MNHSHDIKVLTWFPKNSVLKILIKILNCVGYTYMRGWFFTKVCLNAFYDCPVILRCFLVWIIRFEVNLRNFNPRKISFLASFWCETIFSESSQASPTKMQQVKRNRIILGMPLHFVALFDEVQETISNTISFKNIQKYSQKIGTILTVPTSSIIWSKPIYISKFPGSQKILGIQSTYHQLF